MSVGLWVLAGAVTAGLAGWKLGRASGLWTVTQATGTTEAEDYLAGILAAHIAHIDKLEQLLAAYEHQGDLDAELRQLTEGGGTA